MVRRRRVAAGLFGAALAAVAALLPGCGPQAAPVVPAPSGNAAGSAEAPAKPLRVLCSFFPIHLMARNVVGDAPGVTVELMLPASKGCPHDYDLGPGDKRKMAAADVFVYNGAGLEDFPLKLIRKENPKLAMVDSSPGIKLIECDHDHDHPEGEVGHHHHHGGNPHFFSSPRQAAMQVRNIAKGLAEADPSRAATYRANAEAYAAKLEKLADEFKAGLAEFKDKNIVTMHEIFAYLAADAGFTVVGEILEGKFKDSKPYKAVIEVIRKKRVPAVFTEPQYQSKDAEAIAREAGCKVMRLDPVASGPDDAGRDHYETVMRANLAALRQAFGGK